MYTFLEFKELIKKNPVLCPVGRIIFHASRFPYLFWREKQFKDTFLVSGMRKAGTHYLLSILSNYLVFEFLGENERIGYREMLDRFWEERSVTETLEIVKKKTGYSAWRCQHERMYIRFNNAKVIIHNYRNPLDVLVSRYFFFCKNRPDPRKRPYGDADIKSPSDLIDFEMPLFIKHYNFIDEIINRSGPLRVKRIAYENLVREPLSTVGDVLSFAKIPINENNLLRAVEVSAMKNVQEDEKRYGIKNGNVISPKTKVSFIRSGQIGEWKDYLSSEDVNKIEKMLSASGISLSNFILE